jgi:hypothetical protein
MKVKVRQSNGFRPVTVKVVFNNQVEYECYRVMMGDFQGSPDYKGVPYKIASGYTGIISALTKVALSGAEVEACLTGVMRRIHRKLPMGGELK